MFTWYTCILSQFFEGFELGSGPFWVSSLFSHHFSDQQVTLFLISPLTLIWFHKLAEWILCVSKSTIETKRISCCCLVYMFFHTLFFFLACCPTFASSFFTKNCVLHCWQSYLSNCFGHCALYLYVLSKSLLEPFLFASLYQKLRTTFSDTFSPWYQGVTWFWVCSMSKLMNCDLVVCPFAMCRVELMLRRLLARMGYKSMEY